MTTEIEEVVDGEIVADLAVVPYTGEALSLGEMTFAQLGEVLDNARIFEQSDLRNFKQAVQQEILDRMDRNAAEGITGAWTVHDEHWKLSGTSPNQTEFDIDKVRDVLDLLIGDKLISKDAADKVLVPTGWRVAKRELNQLMKLGGSIKELLAECEVESNKPRRVSITVES